jgi:hypothetical protein
VTAPALAQVIQLERLGCRSSRRSSPSHCGNAGVCRSSRVAGDDDVVLLGEHDGVDAVAQLELRANGAHVALDRASGNALA